MKNKDDMIKWLTALKADIGQGQYQGLWHYEEILDIVVKYLELSEQIHGEWVKWTETIEDDTGVSLIPHWKCSICNTEYDPYFANRINFCPNCGAYMKGKGVSNERVVLENLLDEIKEILTFYSFDVPMVYGDGEETVEKAVLLEEVEHTIRCILNDILELGGDTE